MTIPYNHETPDVVVCRYCSEDFEKESPYIRHVYRRTKDNHNDAVIICMSCFNDLSNRKEIVGISSKTISPPSNIIYWEFTNIDIKF
jgi:hypothetical protein